MSRADRHSKPAASRHYGVGIIQQGNVLRALAALGLLERYVNAGVGYPANLGIGRPALQTVLRRCRNQAAKPTPREAGTGRADACRPA
jgi:hypothetical protein